MSIGPRFSIIVPVYNRPHEVEALLTSLVHQTISDFEVVIIEDGSTQPCESVCRQFQNRLTITYHAKPNSGPGPSRNVGFAFARGTYLVVFDSDCRLPPHYFESVENALRIHQWDVWGGPDRGHSSFTPIQQAMAYTMSSVLTTGGIRGNKKHVGWFQPRSFNMGMHRLVFEKTGGFQFDRYAEDVEFSIRLRNAGYRVGLIEEAFVYHQRRENLLQFWWQVANFGKGRVMVGRKYPAELKWVHAFPTLFLMALVALPLLLIVWPRFGQICLAGFSLFFLALFFDCLRQTRSLVVAFWALPAALVQLTGYGFGFLKAYLSR
jgi:glycosyltransferase involved in cell wall biosynthesis